MNYYFLVMERPKQGDNWVRIFINVLIKKFIYPFWKIIKFEKI